MTADKSGEALTNERLAQRLEEFAHLVAHGDIEQIGRRMQTLRVPVDFDHDADVLFTEAAKRLRAPLPPVAALIAEDVAGAASDAACTIYPGAGQAKERDAFCVGAAYSVTGKILPVAPPVAAPSGLPELLDSFSQAKDWRQGDYAARIEWLLSMHKSMREEIERLSPTEPLSDYDTAVERIARHIVNGWIVQGMTDGGFWHEEEPTLCHDVEGGFWWESTGEKFPLVLPLLFDRSKSKRQIQGGRVVASGKGEG